MVLVMLIRPSKKIPCITSLLHSPVPPFAPLLHAPRSYIPARSSQGPKTLKMTDSTQYPVTKTDDEWRAILTPEQFRVVREKGTEAAFTGEYDTELPDSGIYRCVGCSAPLYKASHKFDSGCGWPAYFDSFPGAVKRMEDRSYGRIRTEIVCANCGGHLGHVFKGEGYNVPTDERHCVNSVSLRFSEEAL